MSTTHMPDTAGDTTPDTTRDAGVTIAQVEQLLAERERSRRSLFIEAYAPRLGAVFLPTGLVLILLGWYGAAHTPWTFEQTPYLISGGLLGVALAVTGGILYFGGLLTQLGERNRLAANRLAGDLEALRRDVASSSALRTTSEVGERAHTNGSVLVATPTGSMVHRADCQVVASRTADELVTVGPNDDAYRACKLCAPLEN